MTDSAKDPLTKRQMAVLDFIGEYIHRYQSAPSYREVAEHFGFFITAAKDHIEALERKGWIGIRRRSGTKGKRGSMNRCIFITQ